MESTILEYDALSNLIYMQIANILCSILSERTEMISLRFIYFEMCLMNSNGKIYHNVQNLIIIKLSSTIVYNEIK